MIVISGYVSKMLLCCVTDITVSQSLCNMIRLCVQNSGATDYSLMLCKRLIERTVSVYSQLCVTVYQSIVL